MSETETELQVDIRQPEETNHDLIKSTMITVNFLDEGFDVDVDFKIGKPLVLYEDTYVQEVDRINFVIINRIKLIFQVQFLKIHMCKK